MSTHRGHVALPMELVAKIDEAVGPRRRSAFLARVAEAELRRMRLIAVIQELREKPARKDEDHPELADGSAAWVRKLRAGGQKRLDDAAARWDAE